MGFSEERKMKIGHLRALLYTVQDLVIRGERKILRN